MGARAPAVAVDLGARPALSIVSVCGGDLLLLFRKP